MPTGDVPTGMTILSDALYNKIPKQTKSNTHFQININNTYTKAMDLIKIILKLSLIQIKILTSAFL